MQKKKEAEKLSSIYNEKKWHEILTELVCHTKESSQSATSSEVKVTRGHITSPKSVKRQSHYQK